MYFGHNSVKTWQLLLPFYIFYIGFFLFYSGYSQCITKISIFSSSTSQHNYLNCWLLVWYILQKKQKADESHIFQDQNSNATLYQYTSFFWEMFKKNSTIIFAAEIDFSPSCLKRCYYLKAEIVEYLWRLSFGASLCSEDWNLENRRFWGPPGPQPQTMVTFHSPVSRNYTINPAPAIMVFLGSFSLFPLCKGPIFGKMDSQDHFVSKEAVFYF